MDRFYLCLTLTVCEVSELHPVKYLHTVRSSWRGLYVVYFPGPVGVAVWVDIRRLTRMGVFTQIKTGFLGESSPKKTNFL